MEKQHVSNAVMAVMTGGQVCVGFYSLCPRHYRERESELHRVT